MGLARLMRRWGLAVVLAIIALVTWQVAEAGDTDMVSVDPIEYERGLQTPMLSARRMPRTLQAPVVDDRVSPILQRLINDSPVDSCLFVQVDDRPLTPSSRVDVGLVPASNQKILTTYAALQVLEADHTFTTRVVSDAPLVDGVIDGNLYVIGGGDPYLSTEEWWTQYDDVGGRYHTRLEDLADEIAATGILQVTGALIGDESRYDTERQGMWADRLISSKQSGPLSALSVNEGFIDWPEEFVGARGRSETDDPALHAVSVLNQLLAERGVSIAGLDTGVAPTGALDVATIDSPPLIEILTHINSHSSNFGAEMVLKELGVATGRSGSAEAGAAVVLEALAADGIPVAGLQLIDGSGLAETNRVTCQAVAAVLINAGPDSAFADTMALAGERGTLLERMVDTAAEGLVAAKTGTLQDATALSGYARSATTPDVSLVFAYIVNEPFVISNQDVLDLQDAFAADLVSYPQGPTIDQLSPLDPVPLGPIEE